MGNITEMESWWRLEWIFISLFRCLSGNTQELKQYRSDVKWNGHLKKTREARLTLDMSDNSKNKRTFRCHRNRNCSNGRIHGQIQFSSAISKTYMQSVLQTICQQRSSDEKRKNKQNFIGQFFHVTFTTIGRS